MRLLTGNRSILATLKVTWRHVPLSPPVPPKPLPLSPKTESLHQERARAEKARRVETEGEWKARRDVTEVGHVLPAIRKIHTAEAGTGAGGVAEGDSLESSISSGKADNGSSSNTDRSSNSSSNSNGSNSSSGGSSSSSSSSSNTGNGDDRNVDSISSWDVHALAGGEAHRQRWDGKKPALQDGRTRFHSKQYQMSADTADALLAHAQKTVKEDTGHRTSPRFAAGRAP